MLSSGGSKIISGHMGLLKAAGAASSNILEVHTLGLEVPLLAMERFTRIIENPRSVKNIDLTDVEQRLTEAYGLASGLTTGDTLILPIDSLATNFQHYKRERNQKWRPKDVCSCLLVDVLEKLWEEQPTDRWLREDAKEQLQLSTLELLEVSLTERIKDDGLEEVAEVIRNTASLIGLLLITSRIRAQDDLCHRLSGLGRLLEHGVLPIGHMAASFSLPICVAVSFHG